MATTTEEMLSVARDVASVFRSEAGHDATDVAVQPPPRSCSPPASSSHSSDLSHLPSPILTPRMRHPAPPSLPTIPSGSDTSSLMSSASSSSSSSDENLKDRSRASSDIRAGEGGSEAKLRCKSRSSTVTGASPSVASGNGVRRLSVQGIQELENPESLPLGPAPPAHLEDVKTPTVAQHVHSIRHSIMDGPTSAPAASSGDGRLTPRRAERPGFTERTSSTPPTHRTPYGLDQASSPRRNSFHPAARPPPLNLGLETSALFPDVDRDHHKPAPTARPPSPIPTSIPLPPMSLHTHLQLELAGQRPSPLYIHHSHSSDIPYESSAIKFERLKSVIMLPPYLERTIIFGALTCLDAWLFTFTILPIRSIVAVGILIKWWGHVLAKEARWVVGFVWYGLGRLWARARSKGRGMARSKRKTRIRSETETSDAVMDCISDRSVPARSPSKISIHEPHPNLAGRSMHPNRHSPHGAGVFRHRRTASQPSNLSSCNKADLLQGALILVTSVALMWLDASRMYHFIRAQSAIKLYVIYNVLEVGDRLLSALGQDIFECLFSSEMLSRNSSGRSKVLLPFGMFLLALAYNVIHSITLYYQVITLNVAVNSYSNALLTLLLSNQFVEIKSTVFKRIEKDNLFQLTCADIVERFQLWIMLLIIALRNIVEVGGISVPGAGMGGGSSDDSRPAPLHSASILPHSFTVLPSWIWTGAVLSPFLIVTFSEVVVDTIKHAYVVKFNNIKPTFYGRILDIICKDYYTNAFSTPSLTRRLGLAVIPMACLFVRSSIQTYNMFLATNLPAPLPPSTQTSLATSTATPSSAPFLAALDRFDSLLRDALGRSVYSHPYAAAGRVRSWWSWTSDDFVAATTMLVVFFILFLVLLIAKLLLGMLLLRYARNRYAAMKTREHMVATRQDEHENHDAKGRRVGGFAQVEVPDEVKRWVNVDPNEGLKRAPPKNDDGKKKEGANGTPVIQQPYSGNGVERFEMVAKRIW